MIQRCGTFILASKVNDLTVGDNDWMVREAMMVETLLAAIVAMLFLIWVQLTLNDRDARARLELTELAVRELGKDIVGAIRGQELITMTAIVPSGAFSDETCKVP